MTLFLSNRCCFTIDRSRVLGATPPVICTASEHLSTVARGTD